MSSRNKKEKVSKRQRLFGTGKPKGPAAPTTGQAIQNLRETEDILLKKQEYLEAKIQKEVETAKKNARTNKRVALNALKNKKKFEAQLLQIDGTLTTIEQQRETLESANTNMHVLKNMSEGARALKQANNKLDVDQVHDMMDDIAEQRDVADEIARAISQPVNFYDDIDEDDLEQEFNALLEEDEQDIITGAALSVPDVPTTSLPEVAVPAAPAAAKANPNRDEDDMEALAAWAS